MKNSFVLTILAITFNVFICIGQQNVPVQWESLFENSVEIFSETLEIPSLIPHSPVWVEPLFPPEGTITTNFFSVKINKNDSSLFQIYSNDVTIASGKLYEHSSFDSVRKAFIMQLVMRNMAPSEIAQNFELLADGVGDLRIKPKPEVNVKTWGFHFVRGGKAISLYPSDGVDVQPIAELLDGLLKQSAASP